MRAMGVVAALLMPWPVLAQIAPPVEQVTAGFEMAVPFVPPMVRIAGVPTLRYELHLTNFARVPLTLEAVEVIDSAGGVRLALSGDTLAAAMRVVGGAGDGRIVESGRRAVVFVDLPLTAAGTAFRHRLRFAKEGEAVVASGALVTVAAGTPARLGPPLRGGPWLAVFDPALRGGHRQTLFATAGKARVPGRFAIDWMPAPGGPGPGAEILAVADAMVAGTHDGVPEPVPGRPAPEVSAADEAGNSVVLDLGEGRFVHYQHMMPGLTVRAGERVRRGQVLGRLGATGHVTKPHLHLHVADGSVPLAAEGLPFALTEGRVIGRYASVPEAEAGGPWQPAEGTLGAGVSDLPPPNAVVVFPE